MKQITFSEVFHSIQGEGLLSGVPSVFFRTSGCNLRCWYCDTPYTSHYPENKRITVKDAAFTIKKFECEHVVITGGEPYIQLEALTELCKRLRFDDKHITIETNGTVFSEEVSELADLISISPKLRQSGPTVDQSGEAWVRKHEEDRINLEALDNLITQSNDYQFKFVLSSSSLDEFIKAEIVEIQKLQRALLIPSNKLFLMPEGTVVEELEKAQELIAKLCIRFGWRYSDRIHVRIWGDERGK